MVQKLSKSTQYIVGIDEVGRGPLAGPVAVCAFCMPVRFNACPLGPLKDSKKLTAEKRNTVAAQLKALKESKTVSYAVCYESAARIDAIGISAAIKSCLKRSLSRLSVRPEECLVLLDGGLSAPSRYRNQKTIIKGDEKERAIACASILAKVSRDHLMCRLAKKYPQYGFEIHKGYGTKKHAAAIVRYGLSPEHRKYFCTRFSIH